MGLATETVAETFRKLDNKPPFGLDADEMTTNAMDKLSRRLAPAAFGGSPDEAMPARLMRASDTSAQAGYSYLAPHNRTD